jgi:hypothetical protein
MILVCPIVAARDTTHWPSKMRVLRTSTEGGRNHAYFWETRRRHDKNIAVLYLQFTTMYLLQPQCSIIFVAINLFPAAEHFCGC